MLRPLSSREVIRILTKAGFVKLSQRGSHLKFFESGLASTVIVPANKKQIPVGTISSIIRQSKLDKGQFDV